MSTRLTRRRFLQASAAGAAGYWLSATALSAARAADSPNGKLRFACIGVGGKGGSDTDNVGQVGQVVALCDVDEKTLGGKAGKFGDAKKYTDFRKLFDELANQFDAVTVSTPDHNHAPASIMAMKHGKHVYCQKPLTHTVYEARQMREVAKKAGVCTQMGNQGSAENGLRRAVELVQSGIIGPVREAHVWTNRPVWPQAPSVTKRPPDAPAPPGVHWDEFIGPAPFRPNGSFKTTEKNGHKVPTGSAYHPFNWRGWWDFGTGALGDMACHTANMAFRALKLGYPLSVVADATDLNPETYPASAKVMFEFPARGEMPAVQFCWYEGKRGGKNVLPSPDLVKGQKKRGEKEFAVFFEDNQWKFFNPNPKPRRRGNNDRPQAPKPEVVSSGSFLVGEKAVLFSPDDYGAEAYVVTESGVERIKGDPEKLPKNGRGDLGMKQEWAEAIKAGKPDHAYSNFDFAAMLTETILLGNVAIRLTGQKLAWDGPSLQFTNNSQANQHLHYEYRKGWTL
ncbi:MAG TPA: Gfo/Idh/MocA family oxidoreductase [Gemmataceae bacterium]|nr:Gfo/Idh/MocA family oxidoreductase [Gemmataceae bacterium]